MSSSPRKRRLGAEQRRALALLDGSPHGITEEFFILGHGLNRSMLPGLVRAGLALVERRVIIAGNTPVEVGKVRITAAGRR
jgi:hypothetical protein